MLKQLLIILSLVFFMSCATTKTEDSAAGTMSEEDARQKELDEIEALLGVERPASDKAKQKTKKDEDALGLLNSGDVPVKSQKKTTPPKPAVTDQKEIDKLKNQLAQKEAQITDLKRQIKNQNMQISQLEAQKSTAAPVYSATMGDVSPGEYEQRYQQGYDLFHSRNYQAAIEAFESLIASNSNHSLADNAQFWIGESHYALGQYRKAIIDFEKVFTFPKSNKNPDAQFKLGLCYLRLGETGKARDEFQRLVDVYPNSDYVSRAQEHLGKL